MDKSFNQQLEAALKVRDGLAVKELIGQYLAKDLSDEAEGELYALMLRLYMKLQTQVNAELSEFMKERLDLLSKLNALQDKYDDKAKLIQARKKLQ